MVLLFLFLFFWTFIFLLLRKFRVSNRKIAWVYSFALFGMGGCVEYHWGLGTLWQLLVPLESGVNIVHNKEGWVEYETPYQDDMKHGTETRYHENGSVRWVRTYKHGTEIGKSMYFYKGRTEGKNGRLNKYEIFDEQGREQGTWINKKSNGDLLLVKNYRDGKKHGIRTVYHGDSYDPGPPGFLNLKKSESFWAEGLKDSMQTTWHENGQMRSREYYLESYRHGTWRYWDSDGKLTDSDVYERSICIADCEGVCWSNTSAGGSMNSSRQRKYCERRLTDIEHHGEVKGVFDFSK